MQTNNSTAALRTTALLLICWPRCCSGVEITFHGNHGVQRFTEQPRATAWPCWVAFLAAAAQTGLLLALLVTQLADPSHCLLSAHNVNPVGFLDWKCRAVSPMRLQGTASEGRKLGADPGRFPASELPDASLMMMFGYLVHPTTHRAAHGRDSGSSQHVTQYDRVPLT